MTTASDIMMQLDDDKKEIAQVLTQLRKKYDEIKLQVKSKQEDIDSMRRESEQITLMEEQNEMSEDYIKDKISSLKEQIEQTQNKHEEAITNRDVQLHMLSRMKKDRIATDIKLSSMENNLKLKNYVLYEEANKFRKTKEGRAQSRSMLEELSKEMDNEQKKRLEKLSILNKAISNKKDAAVKREERQKRQLEIAEAAANEERDSNETRLRESLLSLRFWYGMQKERLEKEMKKSEVIESAFTNIRAAIISPVALDISEIVHKFLTREQTYSQLLVSVADAERKIDQFKIKNNAAKNRIQELELTLGLGSDMENNTSASRSLSQHMQKKQDELNTQAKQLSTVSKNSLNSELALQQVKMWINKIRERLEPLAEKGWFGENKLADFEDPINIQFVAIKIMIQKLLDEEIVSKKEEFNEVEFTKRTEMVEILDNEFSLRNVRVRSKNNKYDENRVDTDDDNYRDEEELNSEITEKRKEQKILDKNKCVTKEKSKKI